MTTKFKFNDLEYPIKINYFSAINTLPENHGIRLTKLFTDGESLMDTMNTLLVDDEATIKLMWSYMEPHTSMDFDDYLERLQVKDLSIFREAFWNEVVNFSDPLKTSALRQMWDQSKRELKKATLNLSFSDSLPEESTSSSTPSDN